MIYTLTLNPSVDYIVKLESFQIGELNRTIAETKYPGGKGINVSRVLRELGVESAALGFTGGFTGKYIEDYLQNEGIKTDFNRVKDDTRINVKIKTGKESEINANGPLITEEDFQSLKNKIAQLSKDDILVLAGSIPKTLPETTYEQIAEFCSEHQIQFVCDAEGELLKRVLSYHPLLIKPNHHELGALFNTAITSCEEVVPYGKRLVEMGAENVIVSLADKGAVFLNKETALIAEVPKGEVKNSVGAGDSMVAGFLAEYQQTADYKKAFQQSVASGSATAFSLGLCTSEQIAAVLPKVHIKQIF